MKLTTILLTTVISFLEGFFYVDFLWEFLSGNSTCILPARYICSKNSGLYGLHVTSNVCLALHHPPVLCHLV